MPGPGVRAAAATSGANSAAGLTPVLFIFLFYFFSTTGELCLSPVGLSAMNRLSVTHMASLMMAGWFFGTAGGNFVAGFIGSPEMNIGDATLVDGNKLRIGTQTFTIDDKARARIDPDRRR